MSDLAKRVLKQYRDIALMLLYLAAAIIGYYGFKHGFNRLLDPIFQITAVYFGIAIGLFAGPFILMPLIVEILKARGFDLNTLSSDYQGAKENWKIWTKKYFLSAALTCVFFMLGGTAVVWFLNDSKFNIIFALGIGPVYFLAMLVMYPLELLSRSYRKMKNPYAIGIPRMRSYEKSSPAETGED